MKIYPLWKFVHRILVVRLGLAALFLAVVIGLIGYSVQHRKLESEVADLGRQGMFSLLEKVQFIIEKQKTDVVTALRDVVGRSDPPWFIAPDVSFMSSSMIASLA